jgi:hypothetical protein
MPGIICLEGNWNENNLSKEISIAPVLQHLSTNMNIKVIHKHCSTVVQLKYYFNLLSENRKYKGYGIIYLAFHGRSGNIYLDKHNHISLAELMQLSMENKKTKKLRILCVKKKLEAAENMFLTYTRLLGPKAKLHWDSIVSQQVNCDQWKNLQGAIQSPACDKSISAFNDCVTYHLLTCFTNDVADRQKRYMMHSHCKPTQ